MKTICECEGKAPTHCRTGARKTTTTRCEQVDKKDNVEKSFPIKSPPPSANREPSAKGSPCHFILPIRQRPLLWARLGPLKRRASAPSKGPTVTLRIFPVRTASSPPRTTLVATPLFPLFFLGASKHEVMASLKLAPTQQGRPRLRTLPLLLPEKKQGLLRLILLNSRVQTRLRLTLLMPTTLLGLRTRNSWELEWLARSLCRPSALANEVEWGRWPKPPPQVLTKSGPTARTRAPTSGTPPGPLPLSLLLPTTVNLITPSRVPFPRPSEKLLAQQLSNLPGKRSSRKASPRSFRAAEIRASTMSPVRPLLHLVTRVITVCS